VAEKHRRRSGNYIKTVLSLLFSWGKERGFIDTNPAIGIKALKPPRGTPQANRPWSDSEREIILANLPPHCQLPIHLMMYCGLDLIDALKLPRNAIKNGLIDTKRAKTSAPVWIPLPTPVQQIIEAAPSHTATTFCVDSCGEPWTTSSFNSSWQKIKKRLEQQGLIQPGLTLKGLRHTVATILERFLLRLLSEPL